MKVAIAFWKTQYKSVIKGNDEGNKSHITELPISVFVTPCILLLKTYNFMQIEYTVTYRLKDTATVTLILLPAT
jgi:hypothetical protein